MSETCDSCGQVISKATTVEEVFAAIKKFKSPWSWANSHGEMAVEVPNVGRVSVAELSDNFGDDPGYDELRIHMVFEVSDGLSTKFYKLEGERSSYDGTTWKSYLSQVTKQKKEVWVYQ